MTRSLRQEPTTTARRTIELQARTSDLQRFRTAIDSTGDAIFLVDRDSMRFVEVKATAVDMLGYSRDELLETVGVNLERGELHRPAEICSSAHSRLPAV